MKLKRKLRKAPVKENQEIKKSNLCLKMKEVWILKKKTKKSYINSGRDSKLDLDAIQKVINEKKNRTN